MRLCVNIMHCTHDVPLNKIKLRHVEFVRFKVTLLKHVLSSNVPLCSIPTSHGSFLAHTSLKALLMHTILDGRITLGSATEAKLSSKFLKQRAKVWHLNKLFTNLLTPLLSFSRIFFELRKSISSCNRRIFNSDEKLKLSSKAWLTLSPSWPTQF